MQIMGETARWYSGTKVNYLDVWLRDPNVNIELGTRYLHYLIYNRSKGDIRKGLRLYNGSSTYPDIIFKHIANKTYRPICEM